MLCRRVTQTLTRAAMSNAVNDAVPHRTNKVLTMDTLNPHIKVMEYAVRGPIVARAAQIEKELKQVSTRSRQVAVRIAIANMLSRPTLGVDL